MSFNIYDDFLDEDVFNVLSSTLNSNFFPWYYNDTILDRGGQTVQPEDNIDLNLYNYQFTHRFYDGHSPQSQYWNLIEPVIEKIGVNSLLRVKANMGFSTPVRIVSGFHTDYGTKYKNSKTGVLYLNTNNGATLFENESEVASVKNRFVSFDTSTPHSGVSSTDSKNRIVINFCYYDN